MVRIRRVSEHCAHFAKASRSAQHSTCHVAQPRGLHLFGLMLPKAASAPPNCLAATPLPEVMIVRMVPRCRSHSALCAHSRTRRAKRLRCRRQPPLAAPPRHHTSARRADRALSYHIIVLLIAGRSKRVDLHPPFSSSLTFLEQNENVLQMHARHRRSRRSVLRVLRVLCLVFACHRHTFRAAVSATPSTLRAHMLNSGTMYPRCCTSAV